MTLSKPVMARLLAAACLGLGLVGCGDLKEHPNNFLTPNQFYQSDAQIQSALAGAWEPLVDYNLYKQPSWIEEVVDNPYLNQPNWLGGTGTWNGNAENQWYVSRPWTGDYQMIASIDQVLAALPACGGCTAAGKKLAAGQAYFLRGWAYFDVSMRFGAAVIRNTPYAYTPTGSNLPRQPMSAVYAQAVADLKLAIDSLPTTPYPAAVGGSRPSAVSAWALLAKVYLHEAGKQPDDVSGTAYAANVTFMDSARAAALNVINSGVATLEPNYWTLFDPVAQKNSAEILWTVDMSDAGSASGSEIADFYSPPDQSLGGGAGQGFVGLRRDFYNTFEPGDLRVAANSGVFIHWHYSTNKGTQGPPAILLDSLPLLGATHDSITSYGAYHQQCRDFGQDYHLLTFAGGDTATYVVSPEIFSAKYVDKNAQSKLNNGNDIHIVRYADLLLTYAEAENEVNGPTAAAFSALNQVRARAGLAPSTASGQAALRAAIWEERDHETFGEGMTKFDLIRQGRWLTLVNAKSALYPTDGPCGAYTNVQQLYPLPTSELNSNADAKQNPGF